MVSYPRINGSETLTCQCPDHQCLKVHWYRLLNGSDTPEFIVFRNNINLVHFASNINQNRFKTDVIHTGKVFYTLRITSIQKQDAGLYSCLLTSQNSAQNPKDLMPEGYSIWPQEIIITQAPTTVKKTKHVNRLRNQCKSINLSPKGCKPLVLWSGVGAVMLLVVVLISTLYYFSRMIFWFRLKENSQGFEYIAMYSKNRNLGKEVDSEKFKVKDKSLELKQFDRQKDSGTYSCVSINNNMLKFTCTTKLRGETVTVSRNIEVILGCEQHILIPLAAGCGLLLLLLIITIFYCNHPEPDQQATKLCPILQTIRHTELLITSL
ncbi:hypothetical protein Baya_3100 [Bagarius yarrelli]|uniref:Ig-like domain-containing protein n=1 Tax=Bagarius yarrelli TaxID=175774 RepID=A0A556TUM4_BAGYA|nr:hypothetical protein Baya_3100 [Bagarius yarrelli]